MLIIKTVGIMTALIAVIVVIVVVQQNAFATSDVLKIHVWLDGVDSQTGPLVVRVTGADGGDTITKKVDPFRDGHAGIVDIGIFTLDADIIDVGEHYEVCVYSAVDEDVFTCTNGVNTEKKAPEEITVPTPTGISKPIGDTIYHPSVYTSEDDDTPATSNNLVEQGSDSTNLDKTKEQSSGVSVSFGDDSDNNEVNIDQPTTFADVIKDLVPKAGSAIKNTAQQILN